jgi:hypothetical protein
VRLVGFEKVEKELVDILPDQSLSVFNRALGKELVDGRSALAVAFCIDAAESRTRQVELRDQDGVLFSFSRTRGVDLLVVVWVEDVYFAGVDADNGPCSTMVNRRSQILRKGI